MLVLRRVGREEWRRVMGKREVGTVREGRYRRFGRIARGCAVVGVRMRLDVLAGGKKEEYESEPTGCAQDPAVQARFQQ